MSDVQADRTDSDDLTPPSSRPVSDVATERKCMSCGDSFASEGWHNRLCLRCRKRSVPDNV